MSSGYVIAQLKVTNPENYKEYVSKVTEVVKNTEVNTSLEMVNTKLLKVKIIFQE